MLLNALKISARTWNRTVRPTGMLFTIDRSVITALGPRSTLRGALPNVYCAGIANADGSKQLTRSRFVGLCWQLSAGTAPIRSGRWMTGVMPMFARSGLIVTLIGVPLWIVVTPPTCQPATTYFRIGCDEVLRNGTS